MRKINIIVVGSIKEKYFTDAINEYKKRMQKYADLSIIEVKEESINKESNHMSKAEIDSILNKEGTRILSNVKNDYVIALEVEGKQVDSIELSNMIDSISTVYSGREITFIIGGSYGLSNEVKKRADFGLSFSKMTFPHQLMRVILLEQIYRSFKILNKEIYHK